MSTDPNSRKIKSIKGVGLLISVELEEDSWPYVEMLRKKYAVLAIPRGKSISLMPPLTITEADVKIVTAAIEAVMV